MPLNPAQVARYMNGFLGYGNPTAHWWFFGTEEGGGTSMEEVEARVQTWLHREECPVEHLRDYSLAVGHGLNRWFCAELGPPTQSTWRPLIRAMLTARGIINNEQPDVDQLKIIRQYQMDSWGSNGETFLSEVLPLPAPSGQHWDYLCADWWINNQVPDFVANRQLEFNHSNVARSQRLQEFIANDFNQNRVIFIYAKAKHHEWLFKTLRIEQPEHPERLSNIWINGNMIIVTTSHPTRRGVTNADWNQVGQDIANLAEDHDFNLGIIQQ
jgi:hypothetical protein